LWAGGDDSEHFLTKSAGLILLIFISGKVEANDGVGLPLGIASSRIDRIAIVVGRWGYILFRKDSVCVMVLCEVCEICETVIPSLGNKATWRAWVPHTSEIFADWPTRSDYRQG